ncbi:MAG: adenosylmethionine--8-amino-7-oxononanoate transaminase [Planctomycetaceae bacterium]
MTLDELLLADTHAVWHPFTPMRVHARERPPVIERAEGFELIDTSGRRYLDGISSLWCNVHGHRVPEIDQAIRDQLDRVAHSTLLGLGNVPASQLAIELLRVAPRGLEHVFYSDNGSTAVEAALKIALQYHAQRGDTPQQRSLYVSLAGAYHGDTVGSVSVGGIDLFHALYGRLLFQTLRVPSPVTLHRPRGMTAPQYLDHCHAELERTLRTHASQIAAVILEPLVQGAAGMLVHPPGYLRRVRDLTRELELPLIADEVATGFGRTGSLFACEQEQVTPDLLCLSKGITGGYLPLAATLATPAIFNAFLGEAAEGKTFFHGHTYTGNPLGCAAALASLSLFERHGVLRNAQATASLIRQRLAGLAEHRHVAEVRQRGLMVGIELVHERDPLRPFPAELRTGHRVTLAARRRGVIVRPLGDVAVLMPAPAMPAELVDRLCTVLLESLDEACAESVAQL